MMRNLTTCLAGGPLGDLIVEDQGQVVVSGGKALERDRVLHIEKPRRLFVPGLVLVHFQFLEKDLFLTALADLKVGDEMSLVGAVNQLGLKAQAAESRPAASPRWSGPLWARPCNLRNR